MTRFDVDTAVEAVETGVYRCRMDRAWWIINGPNGGYVAAIVLRAMSLAVGDATRAPRSLSLHYLRPPAEGPAEVHTEVERRGRTLSTVSARLYQGDKLLVVAIGAFATERAAFAFSDAVPPEFPPPAECPLLRERLGVVVELQHRYGSRLALSPASGAPGMFAGAAHSGGLPGATCGGWIRLEEPRLADALLVAAFTDAFPPAVFARTTGREWLGPVPTVDLTVHFRATLPLAGAQPDDYYAVIFRSVLCGEGFVEEDGEVWSRDGQLIAQSRQLALVSGR